MATTSPERPGDVPLQDWVDSLPRPFRPYLRLARFDRLAGAWLLYWPCAWGVLLAPDGNWQQRLSLLLLLGLGALVMRGAGCAYNDIVDRAIDAQVARTRGRPLPSGQISVAQAWGFTVFLCALGLIVLLFLARPAQFVALAAIPLVAAYPYMKRITWWPQLWLGLTFNWGALVGYVAVTGHLAPPAFALYVAGIAWTLAYDTIYALQDIEDDALAGVKSSARILGRQARAAISGFFGLSFALLAFATHASLWLLLPAVHTLWQIGQLRDRSPDLALHLFRSNVYWGLLVAVALSQKDRLL